MGLSVKWSQLLFLVLLGNVCVDGLGQFTETTFEIDSG